MLGLTATLLMFGAPRAHSIERLILLPSSFPSKIPVVSLKVDSAKGRERRFLLDTGSVQSYLFASPKEREDEVHPSALFLGSGKVGEVTFMPIGPGIFPNATTRFLKGAHIDGILGVAFFENHDVLMDFKSGKIYSSCQDDVQGEAVEVPTNPRFSASLDKWDGWYVMHASVPDAPQTHFFIVDTGASCLCIPAGSMPFKKGRGTVVSEGFDDIRGTTRTIVVSLTDLGKEIRSSAFASNETFPLLPPSLISDSVFFSFSRRIVADASR